MVQELRETEQEMMKDDVKDVDKILNRRPNGHYWIVIHHKPTQMNLTTGERILIRVVKDYDKKPQPLLGTIILEVRDGDVVDSQVNLHDMPIDMERLHPYLGLPDTPFVQEGRADIAGSYIYNIL